jgi:hypothetical protein
LAVKSQDTVVEGVIAALEGGQPMTVAALRQKVGVRRQRLLQVLAALDGVAVKGSMERFKAKDGKLREHRVYVLAEPPGEPGSRARQPGSQF